jgi:chemotaxis protein methyltransferase CheR
LAFTDNTEMDVSTEHINAFIKFVKQESEYDFSAYSVKSFTRRINKLVSDQNKSIPEIIHYAENNPAYLERIVKSITVNTTELFRDPEIWVQIRENIIPKYRDENTINVWHPGVSSGQEAYSMMVLLDNVGLLDRTQIIGTDLNDDVLETARSGKYKYREIDEYIENYNNAFKGSDKPLMKHYFNVSKRKNLITVSPYLTKRIEFIKHDLTKLKNPQDHLYNIIVCRNLLIYFNHEMQNSIFRFFYDSLIPGGALIIGRHEGILSDIASKFDKHGTIYIKKYQFGNFDESL